MLAQLEGAEVIYEKPKGEVVKKQAEAIYEGLVDNERIELGNRLGQQLRKFREDAGYLSIKEVVEILRGRWNISSVAANDYLHNFEKGRLGRLKNVHKPEKHSQRFSALLALYGLGEKEARGVFNNIRKLAPKMEYVPPDVKPP